MRVLIWMLVRYARRGRADGMAHTKSTHKRQFAFNLGTVGYSGVALLKSSS